MAESATSQADTLSLWSSSSDTLLRPSEPSSSAGKSTLLPSIYVTFKLVQLVNTFRRRVNARRSRTRIVPTTTQTPEELCETFQRQAVESIDNTLRKTGRASYRCSDDKREHAVAGVNTSLRTREHSPVHDKIQRHVNEPTWQLLGEINWSTNPGKHDLTSIAFDQDLFLHHQPRYSLKALSHKELARLIIIVKDLLDTLRTAQPLITGPLPVCKGDEVVHHSSDPTFIANLEHLLLRLQEELLLLFVAYFVDTVRQHVLDYQRKERERCYEPVFQYPNAKHPLSTTWPWSIRPSLAVLWGVCWMFYAQFDSEGNMVDTAGNIMVPSHIVQQYVSAVQRHGHQPQFQANDFPHEQLFEMPSPLANYVQAQATHRQNSAFASSQPQPHRSASHLSSPTSPSHAAAARSSESPCTWALPVPSSASATAADQMGAGDQQARNARLGLAGADTNNAYSNSALPSPSAAANAYPGSASAANPATGGGEWLPQDFHTASLGFHGSYSADTTTTIAAASWQSGNEQPALVYDQTHISPQRSRNPTPSIRVTTDLADTTQDFPQPQDALYSASSASSLPPDTYHTYHPYNSGHLSPHTTYNMPQETENMQTPVSPVSGHNSPHEAVMVEQQIPRKRSHSVMSQHDTHTQQLTNPHLHSRSGSIVSGAGASPNDANEDAYSPRGSRAFKRGDPPVNEHNKYICEWAEECRGLVFDRKCEWSKHMDKHDRPYRCPHPSCAKLQGFTYSGGLLRHEREVHGKHGGPKAQLMCPHVDCKRHAGKGFTRKENLNEHLRRVHPKDGVQQDSQLSQVSSLRRDGTDFGMGVDDGETPASRISEAAEHDEYSATSPILGKRRRTLTDALSVDGFDERDQEIKRLRAELDSEREARRVLEEDAYRYQDDIRRLQASLLQSGEQAARQPSQQETQA